uniref:Predicted type I site-specific deoxyribonuclease specificity subunit n=1 Tax=uncultured gamma proteobacterium eBACHOT4E07 TaxID=279908 RepID=Q6IVN1_9GAMM|nr:predicted type I site-specific deoxyribonuclease specificity subunit [uncultured gamma proteobacterium eBACHOT4E07]
MSWKTYKLSELCNVFADGDWIESKDQSPEGIRLLQTGNIGVGVFKEREDKARYVSEETFKRLNCEEVFEGDLLISRLPEPVGRGCLIPSITSRAITAVDCTIIRVKSDLVDKRYLEYFIQSQQYQTEIQSKVTGTTRQRISRKNLGEISIVLTSLPVQKQIVEKLDAAFSDIDKAISATEMNIENAETLFSRILIQSFEEKIEGSIYKTLQDVSIDFSRGKSKHRPRNDPNLFGGHYPFIQTGNVANSSKFITHYDKSYNEKGLEQSKLWSKNTVCITIAANIAECGILNFDACFPDSIIGITVDQKQTSSEYVFYLLSYFKDFIQSKSKGAAQQNINLGTFEKEKFPFPSSLLVQSELIAELNDVSNQLNRLKSIYSEKLKQLNSLKSSILNQAFRGELTEDAA